MFSSPWHWFVTDSGGVVASAVHIVGHNFPTNLLLAVAMLAVAQGVVGRERTGRLERTAAHLRAQLAESQLATLRAQLDPHFLFNALNSVAVLARRGEMARVDTMVARLAALLRHSLETGRAQQVPLGVELESLRHYLDIELVRHGDRLDVRWDIAPALEDRVVPSFVLQPLVENAVRHGFTDPARALRIEVGAREAVGTLILTVGDDGEGLTMGDRERPAEGIGIGHTRARLTGLYGDAARLEIAPGEEGRGARVTITIPARRP
jgi:LytS/YehU family sensor histidine kinase